MNHYLPVESLWVEEILPCLTVGACLPLCETNRWGFDLVLAYFTRYKKTLRKVVEIRFTRRQKLQPLLLNPLISTLHVSFVSHHDDHDDMSDWRLEIYPATWRRFQRFLTTVPAGIRVECSIHGVLPLVHPFTAKSFYDSVIKRLQ
jgi:hypothetical protein